MKKIFKKLLIRFTAILCSAILLFLSPCAKYVGAISMEHVQATEIAVYEGSTYIFGWLLALLASLGHCADVRDNRKAIEDAFANYLEDPELYEELNGSMQDTCIQVYNSSTNTVTDISWQDVWESLHEFHDETVDNLTGLYVKYCPALLNSMDDFVADVLNGDVVIPELSTELMDNTFSDFESIQNPDGSYAFSGFCVLPYKGSQGYDTNTSIYSGQAVGKPFTYITGNNNNTVYLFCKTRNIFTWFDTCHVTADIYWDNEYQFSGFVSTMSISSYTISYGLNVPVFSDIDTAKAAFATDDFSSALNYAPSMDSVIENGDIPSFTKSWRQRELERLLNSVDVTGIGSYGHGISTNNWINELPWIDLGSIQKYALSLLDMYKQMINDIINGTYDSDKGIPETYSDAWDETLTDAWDETVEQSTEVVPGESEKDKPTDGDDDDKDKDDPEGGGGGGNANNEDNNPDIKAIIDKIPDELKAYGKCDGFAQSLVEALEESGIAYKIIRVDSEFYIYSDKFGEYIGVGYHYGVQVGDTVYDNLTTYGMQLDAWLEDLGLTQGNSDITWKYVFEIFNQ